LSHLYNKNINQTENKVFSSSINKKIYNQFIPIFILYYIIFTIHIFQHIHFYQSYFLIYYPKLVSYFLKYSYNTITELINHFGHKAIKSHISKFPAFTRSISTCSDCWQKHSRLLPYFQLPSRLWRPFL
jgi:hypothetical protein